MDTDPYCLGRVVDILEASGAFDPGSSPGRGVSRAVLKIPPIRRFIFPGSYNITILKSGQS